MSTYRWDADAYEAHASNQRRWALEMIDKLGLRGDERILDLGCGDGRITAELAGRVPDGSVLGVDVSDEMIRHARNRYPASRHANLRFEKADARQLTYADAFDVVFSNAVLHWVNDHAPVLLGIRRALRPGGRALLQMGGAGNAGDMVQAVEQVVAGASWRTFFEGQAFPYTFHGRDTYRGLLRDAGLDAVRVELIPKQLVHDAREGLTGWVRATWLPYTLRVPEERREQFVREVVDEYLETHPPDEDGRTRVAMVRLEVEAVRPGAVVRGLAS